MTIKNLNEAFERKYFREDTNDTNEDNVDKFFNWGQENYPDIDKEKERKLDEFFSKFNDLVDEYLSYMANTFSSDPGNGFDDEGSCDYDGSYDELVDDAAELVLNSNPTDIQLTTDDALWIAKESLSEEHNIRDEYDYVEKIADIKESRDEQDRCDAALYRLDI